MESGISFTEMPQSTIRLKKWISNQLPDRFVYRYLIYSSKVPNQRIFQDAFDAADPTKTALDIGANRGIVSYYMSKRFPKIHTFEPNTIMGAFLERVLPSTCVLHRCALSDQAGETNLSLALEEGMPIHGRGRILEVPEPTGAFEVQKIHLETLDSLGIKNIGIIKIDVEGHEEKVIRGGMKTILENKPVLVIEIEKRHTQKPVGDTLALILSLGYEGFYFENEVKYPVSEFKEKMQDPEYPAYINDFLFLPK
jgi:FkbM family methyltransferase